MSPCWRGASLLDGKRDNPLGWFHNNVVKKVKYVFLTNFYSDNWLGNIPFRVGFPCLFSISEHKDCSIGEVSRGEGQSQA